MPNAKTSFPAVDLQHILRDTHGVRDHRVDPVVLHKVLLETRRNAMIDRWRKLGAEHSALGLPLDRNFTVEDKDGRLQMSFRGGTISLGDGGDTALVQREVTVDLVGLECHIRQEKEDEIAGSLTLLVPATHARQTVDFGNSSDGPWFTMGPDGERIQPMLQRLYTGPPADLHFIASLVELDTEDLSTFRSLASKAADEAVKQLGDKVGIDAEDLTHQGKGDGEDSWIGDIVNTLVDGLVSLVGGDDDPYTSQPLAIPDTDITWGSPAVHTASAPGESASIQYTHKIDLTGTDDGGDTGSYSLYLRANVRNIQKKV